jgi:hypothetical protein
MGVVAQSSSFFSKSCEQRTHEAPTPQPTPIDVTRLRPWPVPGGQEEEVE